MSHLAARRVALQLDYYMSSQFAGVALATKSGLYAKAGIELKLLPTCPPGEEAKHVCAGFERQQKQQHQQPASLWAGWPSRPARHAPGLSAAPG